MAKSKVRTKKKVRRTVSDGIAHVHASFNNTVITITDRQGKCACMVNCRCERDSRAHGRALRCRSDRQQSRRAKQRGIRAEDLDVMVKDRVPGGSPRCVRCTTRDSR